MAKDKPPGKTKRRINPKRRRVTMWLLAQTADKLTTLATHRKVDIGVPVEEALKPILSKFYVVDPAEPVPPPKLADVDEAAVEERSA
jgi:hypothetical protein